MKLNSKSKRDSLGNRMKAYEKAGTIQHMRLCPIVARMDGRSFHNFTKGLGRPYDTRLSNLMIETTRALVAQTNALVGYTQSDEITLVFFAEDYDSEIFFDGKHDKMVSILSSITTGIFNRLLPLFLKEKAGKFEHDAMCDHRGLDIGATEDGTDVGRCSCSVVDKCLTDNLPMFDARVFSVPNLTEAANALIWREQDAIRNSIQMAARSYFSHSACHLKNKFELMDMLHSKGINWNDYPKNFRRGTYFSRRRVERPFTAEEIEKLPIQHEAQSKPDLRISRVEIVELDLPPLTRIQNRVEALFMGKDPIGDRVA